MLKELFELVKNAAQDKVIENPDVPNEKNDEIVADATDTIASGLRNIVAGGGAGSLLSLFGNKHEEGNEHSLRSNPIVSMMVGYFANKLMHKHNMGSNQSNQIAGSLIPDVLKNLTNKMHSSSDSGFSLESLLNSITGGKSSEVEQEHGNNGGGLQDILSKPGSGAQGGGLMDIVSKLAGGAQEQQQKNGGGGLMDIIKGFMK